MNNLKIIKEKRKTISLEFDIKTGEFIFKIPNKTSEKIIENFLKKNQNWIFEKQKNFEENKKTFEFGEKFLFFGEYFELKFSEKIKFKFDGKNFFSNIKEEENLKKEFIKFYKKEAKNYISKKILEFCKVFDLSFNKLKITSANGRWGSCSSKKNINFSYKLILAPEKSIDYVIIHELAHLKEMNHSEKFWLIVDNYCRQVGLGDFREHKKWLKENYLKTNI